MTDANSSETVRDTSGKMNDCTDFLTQLGNKTNVRKMRQYQKCCVTRCNRFKRNYPNLSFISIPENKELAQKWLQRINNPTLTYKPGSELKVCSRHFDKSQFVDRRKRKVSVDAIPRLFMPPWKPISRCNSPVGTENSDSGIFYLIHNSLGRKLCTKYNSNVQTKYITASDQSTHENAAANVSSEASCGSAEPDMSEHIGKSFTKTYNFKKICRICLLQHKDMKSIQTDFVQNMLRFCSTLTFPDGDTFQKKICLACIAELEIAYNFLRKCEKSTNVLQKYIERNKMVPGAVQICPETIKCNYMPPESDRSGSKKSNFEYLFQAGQVRAPKINTSRKKNSAIRQNTYTAENHSAKDSNDAKESSSVISDNISALNNSPTCDNNSALTNTVTSDNKFAKENSSHREYNPAAANSSCRRNIRKYKTGFVKEAGQTISQNNLSLDIKQQVEKRLDISDSKNTSEELATKDCENQTEDSVRMLDICEKKQEKRVAQMAENNCEIAAKRQRSRPKKNADKNSEISLVKRTEVAPALELEISIPDITKCSNNNSDITDTVLLNHNLESDKPNIIFEKCDSLNSNTGLSLTSSDNTALTELPTVEKATRSSDRNDYQQNTDKITSPTKILQNQLEMNLSDVNEEQNGNINNHNKKIKLNLNNSSDDCNMNDMTLFPSDVNITNLNVSNRELRKLLSVKVELSNCFIERNEKVNITNTKSETNSTVNLINSVIENNTKLSAQESTVQSNTKVKFRKIRLRNKEKLTANTKRSCKIFKLKQCALDTLINSKAKMNPNKFIVGSNSKLCTTKKKSRKILAPNNSTVDTEVYKSVDNTCTTPEMKESTLNVLQNDGEGIMLSKSGEDLNNKSVKILHIEEKIETYESNICNSKSKLVEECKSVNITQIQDTMIPLTDLNTTLSDGLAAKTNPQIADSKNNLSECNAKLDENLCLRIDAIDSSEVASRTNVNATEFVTNITSQATQSVDSMPLDLSVKVRDRSEECITIFSTANFSQPSVSSMPTEQSTQTQALTNNAYQPSKFSVLHGSDKHTNWKATKNAGTMTSLSDIENEHCVSDAKTLISDTSSETKQPRRTKNRTSSGDSAYQEDFNTSSNCVKLCVSSENTNYSTRTTAESETCSPIKKRKYEFTENEHATDSEIYNEEGVDSKDSQEELQVCSNNNTEKETSTENTKQQSCVTDIDKMKTSSVNITDTSFPTDETENTPSLAGTIGQNDTISGSIANTQQDNRYINQSIEREIIQYLNEFVRISRQTVELSLPPENSQLTTVTVAGVPTEAATSNFHSDNRQLLDCSMTLGHEQFIKSDAMLSTGQDSFNDSLQLAPSSVPTVQKEVALNDSFTQSFNNIISVEYNAIYDGPSVGSEIELVTDNSNVELTDVAELTGTPEPQVDPAQCDIHSYVEPAAPTDQRHLQTESRVIVLATEPMLTEDGGDEIIALENYTENVYFHEHGGMVVTALPTEEMENPENYLTEDDDSIEYGDFANSLQKPWVPIEQTCKLRNVHKNKFASVGTVVPPQTTKPCTLVSRDVQDNFIVNQAGTLIPMLKHNTSTIDCSANGNFLFTEQSKNTGTPTRETNTSASRSVVPSNKSKFSFQRSYVNYTQVPVNVNAKSSLNDHDPAVLSTSSQNPHTSTAKLQQRVSCNRGKSRPGIVVVPKSQAASPKEDYAHQCRVCGETYASKFKLDCHLVGAKHIMRVTCKHCNEVLGINDYKDHLKQHQIGVSLRCEYCGITFDKLHALTQHRKLHASRKMHECKICDRQFGTLFLLEEHLTGVHTGQKGRVCQYCCKQFATVSTLMTHLISRICQRTKEKFECTTCKKIFQYKNQYLKHLKTHENSTSLKCTEVPEDQSTCQSSDKCNELGSFVPCDACTQPSQQLNTHQCKKCKTSFATLHKWKLHLCAGSSS